MLEDLAAADRRRADGRRGRRRGAAVAAVVHTRLTLVQPPAKQSVLLSNQSLNQRCGADTFPITMDGSIAGYLVLLFLLL